MNNYINRFSKNNKQEAVKKWEGVILKECNISKQNLEFIALWMEYQNSLHKECYGDNQLPDAVHKTFTDSFKLLKHISNLCLCMPFLDGEKDFNGRVSEPYSAKVSFSKASYDYFGIDLLKTYENHLIEALAKNIEDKISNIAKNSINSMALFNMYDLVSFELIQFPDTPEQMYYELTSKFSIDKI